MGLHIRNDHQMKALTSLSPNHLDYLLSSWSSVTSTTQPNTKRIKKEALLARIGVTPMVDLKRNYPLWCTNLTYSLLLQIRTKPLHHYRVFLKETIGILGWVWNLVLSY